MEWEVQLSRYLLPQTVIAYTQLISTQHSSWTKYVCNILWVLWDNTTQRPLYVLQVDVSGGPTKHRIVTHINPAASTTPEIIRMICTVVNWRHIQPPNGKRVLVAKILLCAAIAQNRTSRERHTHTHTEKKSNRMANLSWGFHYIAHQKRKIIQRAPRWYERGKRCRETI